MTCAGANPTKKQPFQMVPVLLGSLKPHDSITQKDAEPLPTSKDRQVESHSDNNNFWILLGVQTCYILLPLQLLDASGNASTEV